MTNKTILEDFMDAFNDSRIKIQNELVRAEAALIEAEKIANASGVPFSSYVSRVPYVHIPTKFYEKYSSLDLAEIERLTGIEMNDLSGDAEYDDGWDPSNC